MGLALAAKAGGWGSIRWAEYPVYLPTALLGIVWLNHWFRSKLLGLGAFAVGAGLSLIVFGAWLIQTRAGLQADRVLFARAAALYGSLALAGLLQLKASAPKVK